MNSPLTRTGDVGRRDDLASPLDGTDLRFEYQGRADKVELVVLEDRFPRVPHMRRSGKTTWFTNVTVAADAAVHYRFAVTTDGKRRLVSDPSNTSVAEEPFGSTSVALGPSYRPPPWMASTAESGTIEPLESHSRAWRKTRRHLVYLPAGLDPAATHPLLVMHDGPEYVEYAGLDRCLDALVASGSWPRVITLLHQPIDRNHEYVGDPRHISHVSDELIPELKAKYRIGPVIAGGASLGAVASMALARQRPGSFRGLLLQSGSFVSALGGPYKRGSVLAPVTRMLPQVLERLDDIPDHVSMSCGIYDGLVEDHRALVPRLREGIRHLSYSESSAGHHWLCWRDRLEQDLRALSGTF